MHGKIKILYVDDDVNNLNSFKAAFRFDYKILTAANTTQALDWLIQEPEIHIILCDQRMPGKTGVEFLEEIRTSFPKPIRVLITGYSDIDAIIDAINKGNVFRYIRKPWTDSDVRSAVEESYKYFMANSLLAAKNAELQAAYNTLNEFSYSVTHGLREPLMSVLGIVEITTTMDVPDDVREVLNMVSAAMMQLDNFIENTHDHHRLKKHSTSGEIWFQHLAEDFISIYSAEARKSGIKFLFSIEQHEHFRSDETLLRIILNNLLSNAFKYQKRNVDDKFVELNIIVNEGQAMIRIKDNGIGIDEQHQKNIFDAFYKSPSAEPGSGLGLFNVKDAVRKLGGEIHVNSTVDEGSEFQITINSR